MTLEEILDAVTMKYPHSYTNEIVIKIINRVQRELFRTIFKRETGTQFDIIAGNPFYTVGFSTQQIIDVVVNGESYPLEGLDSGALRRFYYRNGLYAIGIYPTPEKNANGGLVIFRYLEPIPLTTNDIALEPEFDADWHMMLVYRVCKELAENARDTDMVNGFVTQINGIEADYFRSLSYEPAVVEERW